jgi:hypothetical protein
MASNFFQNQEYPMLKTLKASQGYKKIPFIAEGDF